MTLQPVVLNDVELDAVVLGELRKLPPLPSIVRFYDNYQDSWETIADLSTTTWSFKGGGVTLSLDFTTFGPSLADLLKHWAVWALGDLNCKTVTLYQLQFRKLIENSQSTLFKTLIQGAPMQLRRYWHDDVLPNNPYDVLTGLKSLLHFMCDMSLGQLHPGYKDFVTTFRLPKVDKFASVRSGEVFLTKQEEVAVVEHIDLLSGEVARSPNLVSDERLRSTCILIAVYQYAFRPHQVATVRNSDVRTFKGGGDGEPPAVHVTFKRAKQRSDRERIPMTRAIKREWVPLYLELIARIATDPKRFLRQEAIEDSFFGLSPQAVSICIRNITDEITGNQRGSTELRHTAAQRLVDAGASKEELAEFLGHAWTDTGLVYFDASPSQAEKVNKALAISPIYSAVAEAARTRKLDKQALLRLPPDQQIGGVPHGIPIAGIGGCDLGQSLCVKNPVLACYTCRKFLPINDASIHKDVLGSLRGVVTSFYDASRGEAAQSPAYTQLALTLTAIQEVIRDVAGPNKDE